MLPRRLPLVVLVLLCCAVPALSQEWTRFRGPNGAGVVPAGDLPTRWTAGDLAWKVALPGVGHSSPVLWGDRIFVTSAESKTGRRHLLAIDARDGRTLWSHTSEAKAYKKHARNSFATSTPVVDADRVYVLWATPDKLVAEAFDHDGKPAWQADLGPYRSQHGYGVSPIRFDDLLIVPDDQDGSGSLNALEAATGKVRWKVPRVSKNATYSTPCVLERPGQGPELILTNWQTGVTAIDPKTGKQTWAMSVFDTKTQERSIASPVLAGDLVLVTCGFVTGKKHFVAVRPGPDGPKEVWRFEKAVSYLPTPLVKGDRVFLCSEQGMATCMEASTGRVIWQERLPGKFSASPVCAGEHLYCVSDDGNVFVLRAGDTFEQIARNPLGEPTQSTPAVAGGRLVFRTESHLMAVGGRSPR